MAVVFPSSFPTGGGAVVGAAGSAQIFLTIQSAGQDRKRNLAREADD